MSTQAKTGVEAGDRALETAAIEIYAVVRRNLQGEETYEAVLGKIAALIQSAMNAQERELRQLRETVLAWEKWYSARFVAERGEGRC